MAIRKRKPTSAGRRFQTVSDFSDITKSTPEKSLLAPKHRTGGRNSQGHKTSRHRGGGHKQQYRLVDFRRTKDGVPAKVAAIEYDPNRTCRIALLHYLDAEKAYILAPRGLSVGDRVQSVFLVAERERRLVAFLVGTVEGEIPIYRIKRFGFIHDLWVEPEYRNEGIARQMVMLAIERFREIGVAQIRLDTAAPNEIARGLFRSCGFRPSVEEMLLEIPPEKQ